MKMKKLLSLVGLCLVAGWWIRFDVAAVEVGKIDVQFSDLSGYKYREDIENLAAVGILQGYEDGSFRPEAKVNRAEFVKMVFAALNENEYGSAANCFPDVTDQWFAPFICHANAHGVVAGYPDGFYRPEKEVSMVESFKIALEAFGFPVEDSEGEWFYKYRDFMHRNNIFSMYQYFPDASATRGEMAFLVNQMLKFEREETGFATERNVMSPGCGQTAPFSPPTQFFVDGVTRSAITVVPDNYDNSKPLPLVFAFHGRTNSNERVRGYYDIEKGRKDQAIFVYPAGQVVAGGYSWAGDEDFFEVMFQQMTQRYCVNMDRVYVVGHSLGAWMANSLACSHGDVIRAAATLGGSSKGGECAGPVAVMQWHNPDDALAAFSGALTTRDRFLTQNRCSLEKVSVEPSWGLCVQYQGCVDQADVTFCPHENDYDGWGNYYTHNWPRGMGEQVWKFFEENR